MEMLRRQFGIAEPVRRGMELKIAEAGEWRPAALGGSSGVHKDILQGRDCEIGWEDVFTGKRTVFYSPELHEKLTVHGRQRAPRGSQLPHRDGAQDEDQLLESWRERHRHRHRHRHRLEVAVWINEVYETWHRNHM